MTLPTAAVAIAVSPIDAPKWRDEHFDAVGASCDTLGHLDLRAASAGEMLELFLEPRRKTVFFHPF